jgi:hypothetical protein
MRTCDYFGCDEEVPNLAQGFIFCELHLIYLHNIIEIDKRSDEVLNTLSYCFSSINSKIHKRETIIF